MPEQRNYYKLSPFQKSLMRIRQNSLHDQTLQIPFCLTVNKRLDFELLKKAIAIETERNDCLRLYYRKSLGGLTQYFVSEAVVPEIPVYEFKSKSEQDGVLSADARRALKYKKGEIVRYILFRTAEGGTGLYICVCHLSMDAFAVAVFFGEIIAIYRHLSEGTPMPPPMFPYEDALKRELESNGNETLRRKNREFYEEFFKSNGKSFTASIAGIEKLERIRRRKKDDTISCLSCFDPLHDATINTHRHLSAAEFAGIKDYCAEKRVPLQSVMYLGLRTYLSKINKLSDDVMFHAVCSRRAAIRDKRTGGCLMNALPLRTSIKKETTFAGALDAVTEAQLKLYRHAEMPQSEIAPITAAVDKRSVLLDPASMLFTCFPLLFEPPEGWICKLGAYSAGYLGYGAYTFIIPSMDDGGLDIYVEHQPDKYTAEMVNRMIDGALRAISAGIAAPDITIGKILSDIL